MHTEYEISRDYQKNKLFRNSIIENQCFMKSSQEKDIGLHR